MSQGAAETYDIIELIRRRLADGRSIADSDVHSLLLEADRLSAEIAMLRGDATTPRRSAP